MGRRRRRRRGRRDHGPGGDHGAAGADGRRPAGGRARRPDARRRSPSRTSTATVGWTATWDLAAAPDWSYEATLRARGVRGRLAGGRRRRRIVHPELGEGQHLELTRSLPERAPITDAAGAPLFAPTEVVNVGVDKAQVTDLPALAAALSAATGVAGRGHRRRGRGRPRGPVRPGHHAAPSAVRGDPGPGVRPARGGLPDGHPAARAQSPLRRGAAGPRRRGRPRRSSRSRRTTGPRATSTATRSACRGCSAPSRSSSPARPGSPSRW